MSIKGLCGIEVVFDQFVEKTRCAKIGQTEFNSAAGDESKRMPRIKVSHVIVIL